MTICFLLNVIVWSCLDLCLVLQLDGIYSPYVADLWQRDLNRLCYSRVAPWHHHSNLGNGYSAMASWAREAFSPILPNEKDKEDVKEIAMVHAATK